MKLALSWLREFVDVSEVFPSELARRVTDATAEVEGFEVIGAEWDPALIRVAEVTAVNPHPNADRLRLATVQTGQGEVTVVCGAPNLAVGQKVAFATEGAKLRDGHTGEAATLKLRPIRGVESAGMVLSERELGLSEDHEGILVLPDDAVVGRPLAEELGDVIFDISTWANRADLLGTLGLGREVAAVLDRAFHEPDRTYAESDRAVEGMVSVTIEDADLCRRFTASVIEGVRVGPSPRWMQERLLKHGMRPINNVVDITNYVMLETGQPLHAFDYALVRGKRIVARRAKPGEKLTTLDDIERELDGEMLVICDGEGPAGIAGVMGGGNSEVSERTTTVLLEVANFKPGSIRRTSTYLKLRTEASLRFEKGLGPEMAMFAQQRALHLFEQLTGGRVAKGIVDVFPGKAPAVEIDVTRGRVERVLGIDVPAADVKRVLGALGFECEVSAGGYRVTPPYWRPDVILPDDVIEDLVRVYGYEHLPTTSLRGSLPVPDPRPLEEARERARDLAVAAGFQEVITYTLGSKERLLLAIDPDDAERREPLAVVNPVAAQHTYLRTTLRPSLLETYASNRPNVDGPLRLFEIGFEYLPVEADLPRERTVLCAVAGGSRETRWPASPSSRERLDFFDAKGAFEAVLRGLRLDARFEAAVVHGLLPGHTAVVRAGEEQVGVIGQVHPELASAFGIDGAVFLFELWFEEVVRVLPERPAYAPPSRFPEVRQDLDLLVAETVTAGSLSRAIAQTRLVVDVDAIDDYREGVPAGKKSVTLRVRYRAVDRTLAADEVAKVQDAILKRLEREFGAVLRSAS